MWRKFIEQASSFVSSGGNSDAEAFAKHWGDIVAFYQRVGGEEQPVKETSLPWRLEQMLNMLVNEEQREDGTETAGPCLELFMSEKMLGQLYSFATDNYPHGMHALVLDFVAELLANMRSNLLPHVAIHAPLVSLVAVSLASPDARFFGSFVKLCHALSNILARDGTMVQLMASEEPDGGYAMPLVAGLAASMNHQVGLSDGRRNQGDLARSGLLALLTTRSMIVSSAFITAAVPASLAAGLAALYAELPPVVDGTPSTAPGTPLGTFRDQASFVALVVELGSPSLGAAVAAALTDAFLVPLVGPALAAPVDAQAHAAMVYVRELVAALTPHPLVDALGAFLVGPASATRPLLFAHIESLSADVATAALDLFAALLAHFSPAVLDAVIVADLAPSAPLLTHPDVRTTGAHGALESFMALGVVHNRSPQPRLDYEGYLLDAHIRLARCFAAYAAAPHKPLPPPSPPSPPARWAEGPFLAALFNRLEEALDNPLALNLALTHVVSLLAIYPCSLTHEYLLNPQAAPDGARSLHGILTGLARQVAGRTRRMPDFDSQLAATKRSLGMAEPGRAVVDDEARKLDTFHAFGNETFLQGVLLLEEFAKDLAAIVHAKAPLAAPDPPVSVPPAVADADAAETNAEAAVPS